MDHSGAGRPALAAFEDLHRRRRGSRDPVAVLALPRGSLLEVNPNFRKMFGVPDPLPPDLTIQSLGAPELAGLLRGWDGAEPRRIRRMSVAGIAGRGRLLPIPATSGLQALLQFTPEHPEADETLNEAGHFERLRALGETAAEIIHQIRVPLSSVQLGVEIVRSSPALDPSLSPRLETAIEQLGRLDRLLGSIGNFTRPRW